MSTANFQTIGQDHESGRLSAAGGPELRWDAKLFFNSPGQLNRGKTARFVLHGDPDHGSERFHTPNYALWRYLNTADYSGFGKEARAGLPAGVKASLEQFEPGGFEKLGLLLERVDKMAASAFVDISGPPHEMKIHDAYSGAALAVVMPAPDGQDHALARVPGHPSHAGDEAVWAAISTSLSSDLVSADLGAVLAYGRMKTREFVHLFPHTNKALLPAGRGEEGLAGFVGYDLDEKQGLYRHNREGTISRLQNGDLRVAVFGQGSQDFAWDGAAVLAYQDARERSAPQAGKDTGFNTIASVVNDPDTLETVHAVRWGGLEGLRAARVLHEAIEEACQAGLSVVLDPDRSGKVVVLTPGETTPVATFVFGEHNARVETPALTEDFPYSSSAVDNKMAFEAFKPVLDAAADNPVVKGPRLQRDTDEFLKELHALEKESRGNAPVTLATTAARARTMAGLVETAGALKEAFRDERFREFRPAASDWAKVVFWADAEGRQEGKAAAQAPAAQKDTAR